MKKQILMLASLISISAQSAEWSSYAGCYETLALDGEGISNPAHVQSWIENGEASFFKDPQTQAPIPSLNFYLLADAGSSKDEISPEFLYLPIYSDRGTLESLPQGARAYFKGKVFYEPENTNWNMEITAEMKELDGGLLSLDYTTQVSTPQDSFGGTSTALLQKVECDGKKHPTPILR